jgi:DNA-directed RNA polymerase specialized sigma24 family protein
MDDTAYREFFEQPTQTYHRRYEALRAVFVDQRSQKEVAQVFGFSYDSMRQLVREFRQRCDMENESNESPFFATSM